jgi:Transport and Golgi organisation 2
VSFSYPQGVNSAVRELCGGVPPGGNLRKPTPRGSGGAAHRRVRCPDVCTVLLRFTPGGSWPLLLAAVRDEFADRSWDPPAAHWPSLSPELFGGRDRVAGGTWLAVRRARPAVAAVLNGAFLPVPADRTRPSRGGLPLAVLAGTPAPDRDALLAYDGFHLILGTPDQVIVWSWDGVASTRTELIPGDHIVVNRGVDTVEDPLVPHFAPRLAHLPPVMPHAGADTLTAWDGWVDLLRGDDLAPDDPRALLVRHEHAGRVYASTSASLVAVGHDGGARFDFTATPHAPAWSTVLG